MIPAPRGILPMAPCDLGELPRLGVFRQEHPGVPVGPDQFGTWAAELPLRRGKQVIVRHTLRELLDELDEQLGPDG